LISRPPSLDVNSLHAATQLAATQLAVRIDAFGVLKPLLSLPGLVDTDQKADTVSTMDEGKKQKRPRRSPRGHREAASNLFLLLMEPRQI